MQLEKVLITRVKCFRGRAVKRNAISNDSLYLGVYVVD
jgi:hypothetical protein